jgi:hypothetical protein
LLPFPETYDFSLGNKSNNTHSCICNGWKSKFSDMFDEESTGLQKQLLIRHCDLNIVTRRKRIWKQTYSTFKKFILSLTSENYVNNHCRTIVVYVL